MTRALDNDLFDIALAMVRVDPTRRFDEAEWIREMVGLDQARRDIVRATTAPDTRQHTLNLEVTP